MTNRKTIPETRIIAVALLAVLIMLLLGFMLYRSLSDIAGKIVMASRSEPKNSLLVRQILIQTREADNFARTYYLTKNVEHLKSFYYAIPAIEKELGKLTGFKNIGRREETILDSVTLLTKRRFEIMRKQVFLESDEKITEELNSLNVKIDETFSKVNEKKIVPVYELKDTVIQKDGFFNRLLGRKEKRTDTIRGVKEVTQTTPTDVTNKLQGDLKKSIKKVKTSQVEKLQEKKLEENELNNQAKEITDKLRVFMLELESLEQKNSLIKAENARKDVNWVRTISVTASLLIMALFVLLTSLVFSYLRKKRLYETVLLDAKQHAEELARAKEMFLADMSHEIKTPLNAIYGFTEQVLETDLNDEQKQQLNIVKKSADYLTRLVNNILSYSKIQAGKLPVQYSSFDLKKELFEMEILFSQQIKNKKLSLYVTIEPGVPDFIQCDLTRFKQILFNLVGNAIKFTEEGYVKIICSCFEEGDGKFLKIKIADTGVGINPEKLPHLFNEYEQAHTFGPKKYDGTGLGLVITKKLAEQLNGKITLTSEENKGTCAEVIFEFKAAPSETRTSGGQPDNETIAILTGKKILIVDDENFNLLLLKTILSKYGINISEAFNGDEAVKLARQHDYDLILMDIRMPVKNGIDACGEIRAAGYSRPILASTAVINDQKIRRCINAGFSGFIYKPITALELVNTVKRYISHPELNFEIPEPFVKEKQTGKLNFDDIDAVANGDSEFRKELITLFHKSVSEGHEQIISHCNKNNWKDAADSAHKMMAPCKHFDAIVLYNTLKYFESLRENEPETRALKDKLRELKKEVEEIEAELKIYL